jgi:hypothetical protein
MLSSKSSISKIRAEFLEEAVSMGLKKLQDTVKKHPMGKEMHSTGTGGDNARYGAVCINSSGNLQLHHNSHPCHAFMKDYRKPVVVYNQYGHRSFINDEADRAWFDFITSDDGPWKEFVGRVVSHTPSNLKLKELRDFIWENGWVWSDLKNHPANLQHNFLVATRMGTEWPRLIDRWYEYTEQGCHPALAFVFLTVFNPITGDTKKWQINNTNKYDWPIDVCTSSEDYVRNFCQGKVEKLTKSYADTQHYTPVNRIFGENGLSSAVDEAYPNRIFELYHKKYGPEKEKCDQYWEKRGTGFSKFNYRTHWWVTEAEMIRIIKAETKRLLGE